MATKISKEANNENLAIFACMLQVIGTITESQCEKVLYKLFLENHPEKASRLSAYMSPLRTRRDNVVRFLQQNKQDFLNYWAKLMSQRAVALLDLLKSLPTAFSGASFFGNMLKLTNRFVQNATVNWEDFTLSVCSFLNLHFNCINITTFELDDLKQQYPLLMSVPGLFVNLPGQVNSIASGVGASNSSSTNNTTSNSSTSNSSGSSRSRNSSFWKNKPGSYANAGAQSNNVSALVGQPNQKIYLTNPKMYLITADKIGKVNIPFLYVHPVTNATYRETAALVSNAAHPTALYKFGSGKAYTDCISYFDDSAEAAAALTVAQQTFGNTYSNIRIIQTDTDKNGYYKVRAGLPIGFTQICYIRAKKLNEEVPNTDSELNEDIDDKIGDVELYHEWMNKSCC